MHTYRPALAALLLTLTLGCQPAAPPAGPPPPAATAQTPAPEGAAATTPAPTAITGQPGAVIRPPADQIAARGETARDRPHVHAQSDPWRLAFRDTAGDVWTEPVDASVAYRGPDGVWHRALRLAATDTLSEGTATRLTAATDAAPISIEVRPLNDAVRLVVAVAPEAQATAIRGVVETQSAERFVGLGERFDAVDQRGRVADVWAQDRVVAGHGPSTYAPVPLVYSSRGYGVALEGYERARFDMAATAADRWTWEVESPSASLLLTRGSSLKDLVAANARLTGMPPLPPVWAFGTIKTSTGGEQQVLEDARRLRSEGIPASAIFAYDAMDAASNIGWPTVNYAGRTAGSYPDHARYTAALHSLGFKALNYFSPDLHRNRANYDPAAARGVLVRHQDGSPYLHPIFQISWIDFTSQDARAWSADLWRRALAELGYDGGMLDLGELLPADARFSDGSTGASGHNRYPLLYAQAAWEAAQAARPEGDVLLLTRSAALGAQKYSSLQWPGDARMTWSRPDGLASLLPAGISFGLSGFPYWHPEVAGYVQSGLGPDAEGELWLRWLQLGTWSPTLRDHYGDHPNDPIDAWKDSATLAAFRDAARQHARLVPYIHAAAAEARRTGVPIIRYLPLEFPNDPRAWEQETSYMLGPDVLVAPVLEQGARERSVYLPAGTRWVDFWSRAVHDGGQEVTVPAPLDGGRAPVFVRAGAVLPMAAEHDTLVPADQPGILTYSGELVVELFPGGAGAAETILADGTRIAWTAAGPVTIEPASATAPQIDVRWPDGRRRIATVRGRLVLEPPTGSP